MAINTDIATISQNPALNGPSGSDPVSTGDDAIRYALSFTAKLRDGVGFTAAAIPYSAIAYTAVQQGGGTGQGANAVKIGWVSASSKLGVMVDATDYSVTWPINVSGNAATATSATSATSATNATNATTATNSTQLGGVAAAEYVRRSSSNVMTLGWTGSAIQIGVDGSTFGPSTPAPMTVTNATNLGGVAAASYAQRSPGNCITVEGPRNTGTLGRAIPNPDNRVNYFNISGPDLIVEIDGTTYAIQKSVSDATLKEIFGPTTVDSSAQVQRIEFVGFRFTDAAGPMLAGQQRDLGVTAQQLERFAPAWVKNIEGAPKQLDLERMLLSTMHALQQALARIDALEAR